jgi:glutathione S-transferase
LLETYDKYSSLIPPVGTTERAKYLKYFFYIASTVDHLVVDSYKKIFVEGLESDHEIEENHNQWKHVAVELTKELSKTPFICGNKFTACDIMVQFLRN